MSKKFKTFIKKLNESHYEDTPTGVMLMLKQNSMYGQRDLEGAEYVQDSYVKDVWKVTLANGTVLIAYVGHHPLAGDFEEQN